MRSISITIVVVVGCFSSMGCISVRDRIAGRNARDFVGEKVGADFDSSIQLCSAGTDNDFRSCRPHAGGTPWVWNTHLTTHTLPTAVSGPTATPEELTVAVRKHYLGMPYFDNDIKPACHTNRVGNALPEANPAKDILDLAATLKLRAVTNAADDFEATLKKKDPTVTLSATASQSFQAALARSVDSSAKANVIWFVTRVDGGLDTLENIPELAPCFRAYEVAKNQGKAPGMIVGVAGFIVRESALKVSLTSRSTIDIAVEAAVAADAGLASKLDAEARASIAASWKSHVEKVVEIELDRETNGVTAYPLWIQFEGVREGFDVTALEKKLVTQTPTQMGNSPGETAAVR